MNEDEVLHPGHRSIRLKDRDYSTLGFYFVTICVRSKRCILGRIAGGQLDLAALGQITHQSWVEIPSHFAQVKLHAFVIMPNHVHGIVEIVSQAGAQHAAPLQGIRSGESLRHAVQPGSLSAIVRSFKAAVTRRARKELSWRGEIWQPNFYERVVRDGQELSDASRYVAENSMKWEWDRENPEVKRVSACEVVGPQNSAPLPTRRKA